MSILYILKIPLVGKKQNPTHIYHLIMINMYDNIKKRFLGHIYVEEKVREGGGGAKTIYELTIIQTFSLK